MAIGEGSSVLVALKGGCGGNLFNDPYDYAAFLNFVRQAQARRPFGLTAYALVPRGAYLLIEVQKVGVSAVVHDFARLYSRYFNKRNGRQGTAIETRHSQEVCPEGAREAWSREVHQIPVYLGLAESAERWSWSSCQEVLGQEPPQSLDKPQAPASILPLYVEAPLETALRLFLNRGYYFKGPWYNEKEFRRRLQEIRRAGRPP